MPIAASLVVKVAAETADVERGLSQADAAVTQFAANASRSSQGAAQGFATIGTAMTVAGGAIAAGLAGAVNAAASFESRMSAVKAASGATGAELTNLSAKALEFGAATDLAGIDANDAATAMEQLAKGGVQVSQMADAAHGALLLASAGEVSVGEAADTAVRAMNIFNLTGNEVGHVADVISAGANKSATDVGQLNAAFNQSASVARGAGLSLEQLTGTLALLAQNGIQGSDAGTSLRTTIQRLTAPTDEAAKAMQALGISVFDNNGRIRDFADIADNLKASLSGLSDEQRQAALQTIFGADAIRVANVLYKEGGTAVRTWTAAVNDSGSAARLGAQRNDNLKGSLDQLKASLQGASIAAGNALLPQIRALTVDITGLVDKFQALSPHTQRLVVDAAAGAAGVLLLGGAIIKTTSYIGSLTTAIQSVVSAFAKKEAAKASLTAANTALQGSMGATGVAASGLGTKLAGVTAALSSLAILAAAGLAIKITFDLITEGKSDTATGIGQTIWRGIAGTLRAEAEHSPVGSEAGRKFATDLANAIDASMAQYDFERTLGGLAAKGALAGAALAGVAGSAGAAATGFGNLAAGANAANAAMSGTPSPANAAAQALASMGVAAFTGALAGAATGVYNLATALGVLSGQQGALAGQMGILQSRIDVLQEKQATGIPLTQAEADELVTLQVAQQRLADQTGILAAEERAHILAMVGLNNQFGDNTTGADTLTDATGRLGQQMGTSAVQASLLADGVNTGTIALDLHRSAHERARQAAKDTDGAMQGLGVSTGVATGAIVAGTAATIDNTAAAQRHRTATLDSQTAIQSATAAGAGFSAGLGALKWATDAAASAQVTAKTRAQEYREALLNVPPAVKTDVTTPGLPDGTVLVNDLTGAINDVPRSFTVTAYVDISGALANIQRLRDAMPSSPAKHGPFRTLPDWGATFASFAPAVDDALGQLGRLAGAMGLSGPRLTPALAGGVAVPTAPPATGGGHTSTTVVNINAPTYGVNQVEDVVVSAVVSAQRRGRL